jgi:hypothetical protein
VTYPHTIAIVLGGEGGVQLATAETVEAAVMCIAGNADPDETYVIDDNQHGRLAVAFIDATGALDVTLTRAGCERSAAERDDRPALSADQRAYARELGLTDSEFATRAQRAGVEGLG